MKTTAKEFIQGKTLKAIDVARGTVLSLVIQNSAYGLAVDTSGIQYGTKLTRVEDFTINGDTLTAGDITLDLAATFMLEQGDKFKYDIAQ
jgi:hypothetical protein